MRSVFYLAILAAVIAQLSFPLKAHGQEGAGAGTQTIEIGGGLILETVPAVYITVVSDEPPPFSTEPQWIVIPPVYETITETITVQPCSTDVKIIPPVYSPEGQMMTPAKAKIVEIPEVTRDITKRVIKTPSRVVKRTIPSLYHPPLVRKRVQDTSWTVKDEYENILHEFDSPEALAQFINDR